MEVIAALFLFLFCVIGPIALVIGLIVWAIRRASASTAPSVLPNTASGPPPLDAFDNLLRGWVAQGRLPEAVAQQVQALIAEERAAALPVTPPSAMAPALAPAAAMAPAAGMIPSVSPQPAGASAVVAPSTPPARRSWGEQLWDAALSMRTRQTLLFLGAFLLVISALVLVVFNWASFPPILQFGLLAGVCGGLWGAGDAMRRRWGLESAGTGLQAVGGVLVPVVAFSLSRPGLLELEPRGAWLLASALSLPIYALAAWRLRHLLFAVAGCLAAASAVLATLSFVDAEWLPPALIVTLACYLPLAAWLRRAAPELAAGPRWIAHIVAPVTLVVAYMLSQGDDLGAGTLALTLWAGAAFYLLATLIERRPAWSWLAAAMPLLALPASLAALNLGQFWWGLLPALMALVYTGLALALEPRARPYVPPGYAGAIVLALLALANSLDESTARWTLPLMLTQAVITTAAYHQGRFGWLPERGRLAFATLGLAVVGMLLPLWILALLDLTPLAIGERGPVLLALAGLYALAAYRWPGRLREPYDPLLQTLAVLLALVAGGETMLEVDTRLLGMAALTAFWVLQALLRRREIWAAAALGNALFVAALGLEQLGLGDNPDHWMGLALAFTAIYLLGATLLRRSGSCWIRPALIWGAFAGVLTLLMLGQSILVGVLRLLMLGQGIDAAGVVRVQHVAAALALAGVLAFVGARWQKVWSGYLVAALLALALLLAATTGFFTSWRPVVADFGYVLCGVTLLLVLLGQALRQVAPRYAHPYEAVGFALLTFAPIPAAGSPQRATLTWAAMALLYAFATWRYRLRWALAPALLSADLALLNGSAWLSPAGRPAGAGLLLLAAAWVQALIGRWGSARPAPEGARMRVHPAYIVAFLSGLGALALASSADDVLAAVAVGLAVLLGLLASWHRREDLAWGALGMLALGLFTIHRLLGADLSWNMAWGVTEAFGFCLLGWAIDRTTEREGQRGAQYPALATWHQPLWLAPLAAGVALTATVMLLTFVRGGLPPLTFALVMLSLLTTTLAVRRRRIEYGYVAGAALILAGLCQLYQWGFRQPQWFVVPAGLYLLALAEGLRRFQGRRKLSQVVEAGATMLLLGVTLGQSLRASGLTSQLYAVLLCVEALLLLGYGLLRQLRVPFFGGAAFFIAGVIWLSVDPIMAANKWMLLGVLGLLMVGIYVLLERRQEQLARVGRAWAERVSGWG